MILILQRKIVVSSLILFLFSILSSCKSTSYQVFETQSKNVKLNEKIYQYTDSIVTISYNLWSDGGSLRFQIFNKTDSVLYIDWSKCNFIYNGYSFDYLKNTSTMVTSGISLFGNETGIHNSIGIIENEKPQVQLPPKSFITVYRFNLNQKHYLQFEKIPKKNSAVIKYEEDKSPIKFRNFLAISKSSDYKYPYFIDNDFWINQTQILIDKAQFEKDESPNSFYAKTRLYNPRKTLRNVGIWTALVTGYLTFPIVLEVLQR